MWGLHIMDWNERDDIGNVFEDFFYLSSIKCYFEFTFLLYKQEKLITLEVFKPLGRKIYIMFCKFGDHRDSDRRERNNSKQS